MRSVHSRSLTPNSKSSNNKVKDEKGMKKKTIKQCNPTHSTERKQKRNQNTKCWLNLEEEFFRCQ